MTDRSSGLPRAFRPKLALRLGLALSLAILPLGLISVYQTYELLEERQVLSETALFAQTQNAFDGSRDIIQSTVSAAETLATIISGTPVSGEACDAVMGRLVADSPNYIFAGFVDDQFTLACASDENNGDTNGLADIRSQLTSGQTEVFMHPLRSASGVAAISVLVPVTDNGQQHGVIWIAVPMQVMLENLAAASQGVDLVLFQDNGDIITTGQFTDQRRSVLPASKSLADLARDGRQTFRDLNRDGVTRDFAVVPIVGGRVLALGSWEPAQSGLIRLRYEQMFALFLPLVIWLISIAVAYVMVHYLVIRHVRRLRSWMRLYAAGRGDLETARLDNAPDELEVVAEAFRAMTRRLSEQERKMEEDIREKTVLLREVHHRVKNNLQLISSMLNMQIRTTSSGEAKHLLRRVQDRVMALSAIHRYLYMARNLSSVRADELLDGIVQQLVIVGALDDSGRQVRVSTQFDPVEISPDQSVPLSLLTTEASINAVKYCGMTSGVDSWINIALKDLGDGNYGLSVVNSYAPPSEEDEPVASSGLGSKLIESFVIQLNGTLEINQLPDRYELHVVFPVAWPDVENDKS
ncbi:MULTISPECIES: histidine kinase dimerization/phosphoacceptor domain -containing protein [unclassified Yoonia]|uniref:histidine kinase dimerization/phosphoacceptor domain -containing protein n=1 Tax=unclassified Yoonia TaxID=2629118 RepID=UPI002AFFB1D1|nr:MULTISPECIES: histidine kinase dimerization/phosphoacceptor domain -containing protein [unclassified Yoonia]